MDAFFETIQKLRQDLVKVEKKAQSQSFASPMKKSRTSPVKSPVKSPLKKAAKKTNDENASPVKASRLSPTKSPQKTKEQESSKQSRKSQQRRMKNVEEETENVETQET